VAQIPATVISVCNILWEALGEIKRFPSIVLNYSVPFSRKMLCPLQKNPTLFLTNNPSTSCKATTLA